MVVHFLYVRAWKGERCVRGGIDAHDPRSCDKKNEHRSIYTRRKGVSIDRSEDGKGGKWKRRGRGRGRGAAPEEAYKDVGNPHQLEHGPNVIARNRTEK
ncbi:pa domain-containing protein, partial [Moniliophthora roreri]